MKASEVQGQRAQVHALARAVSARPPAPGSPAEEDFFNHPRHALARLARDVLTGERVGVEERMLEIMPHLLQARMLPN